VVPSLPAETIYVTYCLSLDHSAAGNEMRRHHGIYYTGDDMYDILNEGTYTDDITKFDFNANLTSYLLAISEHYTPEERDRVVGKAIDNADAMIEVARKHDKPDSRIMNTDLALTCFFVIQALADSAHKQMGEETFNRSQRVAALLRRAQRRFNPD
jgi:hypothetical protein